MQKAKLPALAATFGLCFGFWVLLTWRFTFEELAAGALVSAAVALFSARFFIHEDATWLLNPGRFLSLLRFWLGTFPVEMFKANVDMARRCFGGCKNVNPGIVKVPVELESDYGQAALANAITLTPGTITLDIAEDDEGKTWYYIHWIDVTTDDPDQAGEIIKGRLERGIRRFWK